MRKNHKFYSPKKLDLENRQYFARGGNRFCYIHPDNDKLCIKVLRPDSIARMRARRVFYKRWRPAWYLDDNLNEYKAYQQHAIIKGSARVFDHIPRCYGWQNTDIGIGLVLDYYTAPTGEPAMTVETYLAENGFTREIETKLNKLAGYLRESKLLTKNLLPHNMVIAEDGRLKIIDGIGVSSRANLANFNKRFKDYYIERRINNMMQRARHEGGAV